MPVLRFNFEGPPDRDAVEADVALAIFTAEQIFGKARVRLEAIYRIEDGGAGCIFTTAGEAGDAAARVLAGLTAVRLGELGYTVRTLATAVAR
jgi:hypothetical protein